MEFDECFGKLALLAFNEERPILLRLMVLRFGMEGFQKLLSFLKNNKDESLLKMLLTFLEDKGKYLCSPFIKSMVEGLDEILPLYVTRLTKTNLDFLQHFRSIRCKLIVWKLKTDEVELELISKGL